MTYVVRLDRGGNPKRGPLQVQLIRRDVDGKETIIARTQGDEDTVGDMMKFVLQGLSRERRDEIPVEDLRDVR